MSDIPVQLKEGITLGPSRQVACGIFALSALLAVALYTTGLGPLATLSGIALIGFWVLDAGAKHATRSAPTAIVSFGWYEDGSLWCLDGGGDHNRCTLVSAFPSEWLALLLLRDERNAKRAVVMTGDNAAPHKFRLVRAYLRRT